MVSGGWAFKQTKAGMRPGAHGKPHNFEKLQRLRIAPDFVFDTQVPETEVKAYSKRLLDLRPQSLEFLHIRYGDHFSKEIDRRAPPSIIITLYKAVEHMLANGSSRLPSVKKLILDMCSSNIDKDKEWLVHVLQIAQRVGFTMTDSTMKISDGGSGSQSRERLGL